MKYPINFHEIKEIISSCPGPENHKLTVVNYCTDNCDAVPDDSFAYWFLNYCPYEIKVLVLQKAFHLEQQKLDRSIKQTTFEIQKNETYLQLDIICRRADFEEVIRQLIDLKILNAFGKLIQTKGNKKILIGVILLLCKYGYFKTMLSMNTRVTKNAIVEFVSEKFDAGDMQQFKRIAVREQYMNAALAKVECIKRIEDKRNKYQS